MIWKWFKPGLSIKRWVAIIGLGSFLLALGLVPVLRTITPEFIRRYLSWWFVLSTGVIALLIGVVGLIYTITSRTHNSHLSLYQTLMKRSQRNRGPSIVAIGGGTGLSTLLRGLKSFTSNLTAIVAVTDEGGSSGRLREELGIPAPGDLRNCLVALAPEEERLSELFSYRFEQGEELRGHSMGNLLLAALAELQGGFPEAIRECSDVLAIRGQVLPSMLGTPRLSATLDSGKTVIGETALAEHEGDPVNLNLEDQSARSNPEAVSAIMNADAVIAGPGSLYTSIVTNFLDPNLCQALLETEAPTVYVCNLVTETGETDGYTVKDHLDVYRDLLPHPVEFDHILVNTRQAPRDVRRRYEQEGASQVTFDIENLSNYPGTFHSGDYLQRGDKLRHDTEQVTETLKAVLADR